MPGCSGTWSKKKTSAMTTPPIGTRGVSLAIPVSQRLHIVLTVDVKAPSPGDVRGESAANRGAEYRGNAEYSTEPALVLGSLLQWDSVDNDDHLMQCVSRLMASRRVSQTMV